jgi:hypothetical protein
VQKCRNDTKNFIKQLNDIMLNEFNANKKIVKESADKIIEKSSNLQNSYAEVLKNNIIGDKKSTQKKLEPVVIIKPKDKKQNSEKTKEDIKQKINPRDVPVNGLVNTKDGGILIRCKNHDASKIVKNIVDNELSDNYTINLPENKNPRIKIVGVLNPPENLNEIRDMLYKQNDDFFTKESDIKIIAIINMKKNDIYNYSNIIIETSGHIYAKIMNNDFPRLNFGWNKCKVFNAIHIRRCFKCCSFDHLSINCTSEHIKCIKCAGDHKIKDCKENEFKCTNCENANIKFKLNLDVHHSALNKDCPVFIKKLEKSKKYINYTE